MLIQKLNDVCSAVHIHDLDNYCLNMNQVQFELEIRLAIARLDNPNNTRPYNGGGIREVIYINSDPKKVNDLKYHGFKKTGGYYIGNSQYRATIWSKPLQKNHSLFRRFKAWLNCKLR